MLAYDTFIFYANCDFWVPWSCNKFDLFRAYNV